MPSRLTIQLRTSSILFLLFTLSSVYLDWLSYQIPGISLAPFRLFPILSALTALLVMLGLLALVGQFWHQRHLLGWLGVGLTLCGVSLVHLSLFVLTSLAPSRFDAYRTAILYGSLSTTIGLILWAIDLPNSTNMLRLQKGAMITLGFSPVFPFILSDIADSFHLPLITVLFTDNPVNLLVISDILSIIGWILLGITIWSHQEIVIAPHPSISSDAPAPFELIVSSIPPTESS